VDNVYVTLKPSVLHIDLEMKYFKYFVVHFNQKQPQTIRDPPKIGMHPGHKCVRTLKPETSKIKLALVALDPLLACIFLKIRLDSSYILSAYRITLRPFPAKTNFLNSQSPTYA
jgi:hypothetical protein